MYFRKKHYSSCSGICDTIDNKYYNIGFLDVFIHYLNFLYSWLGCVK